MTTVYFITQGCSANTADSEIMGGLLVEAGYTLVDSVEETDVVIFNTCTVKGPTESYFRKKLKELRAKRKKVVVAGCIPQSDKTHSGYDDLSIVGTYQIANIVEVVEAALKGNKKTLLKINKKSKTNLPKYRKNPYVEIVPICHGCLGACTYCKTKQARGGLKSFPIKDIVRQISKAVGDGIKEIWLSSQDNSAYGLDIKTNLAELLKAINTIDKDFKVRVGMANPTYFPDFIDKFIEALMDDKMYKFIHIPVQSGNNQVLTDMNREYTVEDYKRLIKRLKKEFPNITISTDIICGFPTESKQAFNDSIKLIKETKPDVLNISRFWPRPGTPAALMKYKLHGDALGKELKLKTREMTYVFQKVSADENKKWLGWKGKILITEEGKNNSYIGRNFAYKQVVVKSNKELLGKYINVEIKKTTIYDLRGEIRS